MNFDPLYPYFKYGSVVSIPLFIAINLILLFITPNYSYSKLPVSKSIFLFKYPWQKFVFTGNFYLKVFLDIFFLCYLLNYLNLPVFSLIGITWLGSLISFALIGYFSEDKNHSIHHLVAYLTGVLLAFSQLAISIRLNDTWFMQFTAVNVVLNLGLSFWTHQKKNTNAFIQVSCMLIWYVWQIVFLSYYLK
jgi:hypothetical protein